jgi:hypothetical protein
MILPWTLINQLCEEHLIFIDSEFKIFLEILNILD